MAAARSGDLTELLHGWSRGEAGAAEKLLPRVYRELRRQAAAYLRRERKNHTLVATALVHEAYLRMAGQQMSYHDRSHFFAVAATIMRRVLVDHARARAAAKRPSHELQISLDSAMPAVEPRSFELLSLDSALSELAGFDPRQAQLVELRYFGGLTAEEAAEVMGVSLSTVKREWNVARAWLYQRLTRS